MSLQCVAPPVRALAVLPAPAPPRRRTNHVSLYLPSRRPGLAVAPVRAADSSSPPTVPASAAGKAVVPDDEFSLAKVRSLRYFLLLGTWLQRFGGCHSEQSNADSAVVCRSLSVWSGWGLGSRSCREFWIFFPILSLFVFSLAKRFRMFCRGDHVHVLLHLRYGFGSYFNLLPGSEWSALLLTYGFPLTIIGMALKARTLPTYATLLDNIYMDDPVTYKHYGCLWLSLVLSKLCGLMILSFVMQVAPRITNGW